MGSLPRKSVLMICGDYMEDYEAIVPFQALQSFRVDVHCASPGKYPGDKCFTAIHDFLGFELYTELPGHLFTLNADFRSIKPESYDALIIPGGRFTEFLSTHDRTIEIVAEFAATGKPIMTLCHSQLILAAAGIIGGTRFTAFPSMRTVIELAGGIWSDPNPFTSCVVDGNFISAVGWPAHAELIACLLRSMGARVMGDQNQSILFLCGDYVEDYEMNVPFRAMGGLGCKVDVASPNKKKGDTCVSAIHDLEGAQVCSEKRGHNIVITSDWSEIHADDYDCLVIPGGRSPELLVGDTKVLLLVKEFTEKNKVISSIGHGHLVLAAAGILKGRSIASGGAMKVVVGLAGGKVAENSESIADGKLVTATGWPALPHFISELINVLGLSVAF